MSLQVAWTTKFKKDYKLAIKRGLNIDLLDNVIRMLANNQPLSEEHCDHQLSGNWKGFRECHILPDWLLIYKVEKNILVLTLSRTGSHSDLFNN